MGNRRRKKTAKVGITARPNWKWITIPPGQSRQYIKKYSGQ